VRRGRLTRGERAVLGALAAILFITAVWWAAALWPLPAATPDWVVRARVACFGVARSGLPHAGGWILLIGSPLSMLAALAIIWGDTLRRACRQLLATRSGLAGAALALAACTIVMATSAQRARAASGVWSGDAAGRAVAVSRSDARAEPQPELRRLDAAAGPVDLVDQHGERVRLAAYAGRPLLVTFAFGRCETICPIIVRETLAARRTLGTASPPLLVITVDPWRDTPARLPHIAAEWGLDGDARLLGGTVDEVERALDGWRVERSRDARTGEVTHPSLVYVLDANGRVVYGVPGWQDVIVRAVESL
jgi:protein SCO1